MSLDPSMFLPILPEILLLALGLLVLALDLILPREQHRNLGWVTAVGAGLILIVSLISLPGTNPKSVWGGMVSHDWLGFAFKLIFIFGAGVTALLAMDFGELGQRGEFYVLMIGSTIGMCFMASANDLIMLFLATETTSIPLYVLAGFFIRDDKSTEAGFKYLLFGAMTSAITLYGFSLLYGFTGTTSLAGIAAAASGIPVGVLVFSVVLILVGFGFKISAVPLHFWAPDVYEGAPTPVAGFLSTASKAAGFAVLVRVLFSALPSLSVEWGAILAALSVATMTLGNLIALTQRNIKRLLAYSSIAHAGYVLIGVVTISKLGLTSVVLYLIAYLVTNLAAFGAVAAVGRVIGSDELTAYYGLSRRAPGLSLVLLVALLSLAGMPPLGGFVVKVFIFAAAVKANLVWLAFIGVINSIIGLYYYLTVLKYIYLYRMEGENEEQHPIPLSRPFKLALGALALGILAIGVVFAPWFGWAARAASALF